MKKSLFTLLLAFVGAFTAMAEDVHVTVHGSAPAGVTDVIVTNLNNNQQLATVKVVDGKFTYSNYLDETTFVRLSDKDSKKQCCFVADGATVFANMETGRVMGTRLSNKLDSFVKMMETYDDTFDRIKQGIKTVNDTAKIHQLEQIEVGTKKMQKQEVVKTLEANKDNILPAFILRFYTDLVPQEDRAKYLNSTEPYTNSPLFKQIQK